MSGAKKCPTGCIILSAAEDYQSVKIVVFNRVEEALNEIILLGGDILLCNVGFDILDGEGVGQTDPRRLIPEIVMLPDREAALNELRLAGEMNPGPWTEHSRQAQAPRPQH